MLVLTGQPATQQNIDTEKAINLDKPMYSLWKSCMGVSFQDYS